MHAPAQRPPSGKARQRADNERLLQDIASFCRRAGMAESTFGRRAVNDGKFVTRLRFGGRVTTHTVERVRSFIARLPAPDSPGPDAFDLAVARSSSSPGLYHASVFRPLMSASLAGKEPDEAPADEGPEGDAASHDASGTHFRFYDNRQKYLLFVSTCTEKWVVAQRVEAELEHIQPRPPALRLFDAGVGDGTVLTRVMRSMHDRFPTVPFYIVGKEISLEDVRLALEKMPDRFYEHPASVLVMTNMYYSEAPWLKPEFAGGRERAGVERARADRQHRGTVRAADHRPAGFPAAELDREDQQDARAIRSTSARSCWSSTATITSCCSMAFARCRARCAQISTWCIASQPYRARAPVEFKANESRRAAGTCARPGRATDRHPFARRRSGPGNHPRVWPDENPFQMDRHQLLKATKNALGAEARGLNFNAYSDQRSIFRYDMHTLPSEITTSIGTSTLLAAWNAAIYVAQIEDERLESVMGDRRVPRRDARGTAEARQAVVPE